MRRLVLVSLLAATPALAVADGPTLYNRCAACHLPSGAGVPAAFPPFRTDFKALSATASGRRYLILVVIKGISGAITVDGKPFRGVMPAQSALDNAGVAAVLNHVAVTIAKVGTGFKPFTANEVGSVRNASAALTSADVGLLHRTVGGK
jgi:mono/diheme cytochrome c family protein